MKILAFATLGGCEIDAEIEVPDEEVEGLSEEDQNEVFAQYTGDWAREMFSYSWYPAE